MIKQRSCWGGMVHRRRVCFCEKLVGFAYRISKKETLLVGLAGMLIPSFIRTGPLHEAARAGDVAQVEQLLARKGIDVNAKSYAGWTPLSIAVREGHEAVARLLLDHGAQIEAKDDMGRTPLYSAIELIRADDEAVVRLLLDRGAQIEATDKYGATLLCVAAELGDVTVARLLLDRGALVEAKDFEGYTPLHLTAQHDGTVAVAQLLLDRGAQIEAKDFDGYTPLHLTAQHEGAVAVAQLLLDRGAQIGAKDRNGDMLLHMAVLYGLDDVMRLLLARGAQTEAKGHCGRTPLGKALDCGRSHSVKSLLAFGASSCPYDSVEHADIPQEIRALFDHYRPAGTLKALAARASVKGQLDVEGELIPAECKEYVSTDLWMDDFFGDGIGKLEPRVAFKSPFDYKPRLAIYRRYDDELRLETHIAEVEGW